MSTGEFDPTTIEVTARVTPEKIYKELCAMAFINKAFKDELTDGIKWVTEQDSPAMPLEPLPDNPGIDGDWPAPYTTTGFTFEAARIDDEETGATSLGFIYHYTRVDHNIYMPAHIAAYAYGSQQFPVIAAGPTASIYSIRTEINSATMEVSVAEMVDFEDHNEETVVATDSRTYDEEDETYKQTVIAQIPVSDLPTLVEGEPITVNSIIDNVPVQFRNDAFTRYETHDGAPSLDAMEAYIDDFDAEKRNLVIAYQVLIAMKKAFREQQGIQL